MPVAVNMPNQKQADPLDKLANALNIARQGFGIYTDLKAVEQAKAQKAEEDKLRQLQIKKHESEQATAEEDNNPNSPLMGTIREAAKKRGITLPEGITPKQARTNFDAFLKPKDPRVVDPFVEEMRREKLEQEKFKKTPKGRLQAMSGDQRGRFDNVTMALDALTGMENALAGGSSTFSIIGDNDFTRNETKWEEAVGRMQSGGAINAEEAERFRRLIPRVRDSADQQAKKLADMRVIMEQRFGTFGFDKESAPDLGLDPVRLGWAKSKEASPDAMGLAAGGGAPPKPKTVIQNGHTYTLNPKTGQYE